MVSIRAYRSDDMARLLDIWFEASLIAHHFVGRDLLAVQRQLIEQQYLPKAETYVAERDGKAVGFISLLDHFVGGLFIDPAYQRLSIGHKLIAYAYDLRGKLELEVYTENHQAMAFYQSLGFVEQFRRPLDDDGHAFENARMKLDHPPVKRAAG